MLDLKVLEMCIQEEEWKENMKWGEKWKGSEDSKRVVA
jgi:hypothetical protein